MSKLLEQIKGKARKNLKKIAFDEIEDERILKAVVEIKKQSIAIPILIGKESEIKANAKKAKINLTGIDIIDHTTYTDIDLLSNKLHELRKEKGMSAEQAKETLKDPMYFATMLLKTDFIDGIVSGAANPTSRTLRPALQIIKTREGINVASSYFLMEKETENLFFADCGMNINPSAEELAEIAITTAESVKTYGIEPKVAMLSFSTKGSGQHADADKVIEATKLAHKKAPNLKLDGELQFDAAYVESVCHIKCPDCVTEGNANIFIFPNLDAGNIGYKIAQRLGRYAAIGPIVQGLNKPVNDLSRGCTVEDIIDLCAITSVMQ